MFRTSFVENTMITMEVEPNSYNRRLERKINRRKMIISTIMTIGGLVLVIALIVALTNTSTSDGKYVSCVGEFHN